MKNSFHVAGIVLFLIGWSTLHVLGWMRIADTNSIVQQQLKEQKAFGGLDDVGQYRNRLERLKNDLLKEKVYRVGYFNQKVPGQPIDSAEAWVLTQYALAPIVVHASKQHEYVIVDCLSPQAELEALETTQLTPLGNYGRGIILFYNREAK